jgi:6-phosphogluconolactonase (cycloisomerase 2 family)
MGSGSASGSSVTALAFVGSGNQIYGIAVDGSNHVSTTQGSPFSVSGETIWLATSGHLLFVAADISSTPSSNNITTFRSDANGSLTKLANIIAKGAHAVATETSGHFLYASAAADASSTGFPAPAVYGYAIDQTSGTITPLPGSPWQINHGAGAGELRVTPDGAYVCVNTALFKANEAIQCYPRHSDGTIDSVNYLTPISVSGDIPGFDITNDSTHVLSTDGVGNAVHSSAIANVPSTLEIPSGGSYSSGIASYHGAKQWAAVTNRDSENVVIIELGANGSMAGGPTTPVSSQPNRLAFSESLSNQFNYLFMSTRDGVLVFLFDPSTGALKPINTGDLVPGSGVVSIMHI